VAEKEPGENPSFDPGPIDELRSNSDSGEGDEERSDEAPQGWPAEQAINPTLSAKLPVI